MKDKFEEIKTFKQLLDAGVITEQEFNDKKQELLFGKEPIRNEAPDKPEVEVATVQVEPVEKGESFTQEEKTSIYDNSDYGEGIHIIGEKKKSKLPIIIIVVVLILALIVAGVIFILSNIKDNKKPEPGTETTEPAEEPADEGSAEPEQQTEAPEAPAAVTNYYYDVNDEADIDQYKEVYTSVTKRIAFLDDYKSIEDLVNNSGDSTLVSAFRDFYNKYKGKENEDGYLLVTDDVMNNIKLIAGKLDRHPEWKQFLLYQGDDKGFCDIVKNNYVKIDANDDIDRYTVLYSSVTRPIGFMPHWESVEDAIRYGKPWMADVYRDFYNKYVGKENDEGYFIVNDQALDDIIALADERNKLDEWQTFLLYNVNDPVY